MVGGKTHRIAAVRAFRLIAGTKDGLGAYMRALYPVPFEIRPITCGAMNRF
jgi:hypothetical protein